MNQVSQNIMSNIVSKSYSKIIDISHYSIKNFLDEFINENIYQYFLTTLTEAIDDMQELIKIYEENKDKR